MNKIKDGKGMIVDVCQEQACDTKGLKVIEPATEGESELSMVPLGPVEDILFAFGRTFHGHFILGEGHDCGRKCNGRSHSSHILDVTGILCSDWSTRSGARICPAPDEVSQIK